MRLLVVRGARQTEIVLIAVIVQVTLAGSRIYIYIYIQLVMRGLYLIIRSGRVGWAHLGSLTLEIGCILATEVCFSTYMDLC